MRGKLLRALRHLKAATLHVYRARAILRSVYWWEADRAGVPAEQEIGKLVAQIKQRYVDEVHNALKPAELP